MPDPELRLAAILSADTAGYSRLMAEAALALCTGELTGRIQRQVQPHADAGVHNPYDFHRPSSPNP